MSTSVAIAPSGCLEKTPTFRARRPASVSRACIGVRSRGPPAKMTPRYCAPAASANSASTARVRPQIFTSTGTGHPGYGCEQSRGRGRIRRGGGDARAYQHGVGAALRIAFYVGAGLHAALGDCDEPARDARHQPFGRRGIDDQRLEVTVIDADHRRADLERAVELGLVADLDQKLEPQRASGL